MMRRFSWASLATAIGIALPQPAGLAAQGVLVAPHMIVIDHRSRSGAISLYNPGDDAVEISLSTFFGYPITDSLGHFDLRTVETPDSTEPSAAAWIQAFPRVVTVGPKETQTVRLLGRPPADLPDGEYWARLLVVARGAPAPAATPAPDSSGVQIGLTLEVHTILPVLYRKGALRTGVVLDSTALTRGRGDSLELHLHLTRTGNAAFLGQIRAALVDPAGKAVAKYTGPIAVYHQVSPRLSIPAAGVVGGEYRLQLELASEREDMPTTSIVSAPILRDSLEVRLP